MRQSTSRVIAGSIAVLVAALSTMPNLANAEPSKEESQPVVVVTDFSGSMNEADADAQGTKRIDAAKGAVKNLLAETPQGSRLGLVVYGTNNDSCGDIETLHPVGDFGAAALGSKIDALQAKGNTTIGPALKHAAKELESVEGPRSIVLVSDGEPNCEPPPACEVAKELAGQGVDMTVHTIGFRLAGNAKAQETLQCIADTTGGEYTHVDSSEDLKNVLATETARAMQGYEAMGQEVEGGPVASQATEIIAGQYVTKMKTGQDAVPFAGDGETELPNRRWFAIPHREGWDVHVAATLVPPSEFTGESDPGHREIALKNFGANGDCEFLPSAETGLAERIRVDTTTHLTLKGDKGERCVTPDGNHIVALSRSKEGWSDAELDVELLVAYTKAPTGPTSSESAAGEVGQAQRTDPVALAGGSSFNNAALVTPGQTISDTIVSGERRYYAVQVDEGQNLRMLLEFPDGEGGDKTVMVSALNPLREEIEFARGANRTSAGWLELLGYGSPFEPLHASLGGPIRATNALKTDADRALAYPGKHFIVVARDPRSATPEIPLELTLEPVGEPQASDFAMISTPEQYTQEFGAEEAAGDGAQTSADASAEASGGDSEKSEAAPSEGQSAEPKGADAEANTDGGFPAAPVLGGAGVALLAGGGIWYGLRRRGA